MKIKKIRKTKRKKKVNKAMAPEEAAVLSNIQSLIAELLQMGGEETIKQVVADIISTKS